MLTGLPRGARWQMHNAPHLLSEKIGSGYFRRTSLSFSIKSERSKLQKLIRRKVRGNAISDLLCAAVCCEIEQVGGKGADLIQDSGIRVGVGLRQGMPVSPMLSNLLLKSFDEALTKRGLVALRYADDIAVFGNSREELTEALAFITKTLSDLNLEIPELEAGGKTTISGPSDIVEFLGVEIRRSGDRYVLTAPNKKLAAIEDEHGTVGVYSRMREAFSKYWSSGPLTGRVHSRTWRIDGCAGRP